MKQNFRFEKSTAAFIFLVATLIQTLFFFVHFLDFALIPPAGDYGQTLWNFWWFEQTFFSHFTDPLYTDMIFYPVGTSLVFYTFEIFYAFCFYPLKVLFNVAVMHKASIVFTYFFTMYFTFLLVRYLGGGFWGAVAAGLAFGLHPIRYQFCTQLSTMSTQWAPLFLYLFLRVLREQPVRHAIFLGLTTIALLTSDWYSALFCLVMVIVIFGVVWRRKECRFGDARMWGRIGLSLLVASPVIIFYLVHIFAPESRRVTATFEPDVMIHTSADLSRYWLHPRLRTAFTSREEVNTFAIPDEKKPAYWHLPGYLLMACALLGWKKKGSLLSVRLLLITGFAVALFSLGPYLKTGFPLNDPKASSIPLPGIIVVWLPFLTMMRTIKHLGIFALLLFSVAGGLSFESALIRLSEKTRIRMDRVIFVGLLVVILENWAGFLPTVPSKDYPYPVYEEIARMPGDFAVMEIPHIGYHLNGFYMFNQTFHGKKIVQGFVSREPGAFYEWRNGQKWYTTLYHYMKHPPEKLPEQERAEVLRGMHEINLKVLVCQKTGTVRVYEYLTAFLKMNSLARIFYDDSLVTAFIVEEE